MSSSFEKSVKGATKIKALPPKSKYIEHILIATHAGEAGVAEIFRALAIRLRDSTWTVVFKSLIVVHLMIREGAPDVTLAYLGRHRNALATSGFADAQTQGKNIRHYANYLAQRAIAFRETKFDFVRGSEGRLEKLSVDKGILREAEILQHQIAALLKCDVLDNEPENEITITVFRMLVLDLLVLNKVYNEALINILGHFFEMSKPDAERAMEIYRSFTTQNNYVLNYLSVARQVELQTRVQIPKFKHAPVTLGKQLEEYLKDPDFEVNRRQYLAEQEAKKARTTSNGASGKPLLANKKDASDSRVAAGQAFPDINDSRQPSGSSQPVEKPDTDLIDFFESIEQPRPVTAYVPQQQQAHQQQFAMQQPQQIGQGGFQAQPTGFSAHNQFQQFNNGFVSSPQQQQAPQPLQQNTGAGFGGYPPQQQQFQPSGLSSIPQDSVPSFQTQGPSPFSNMQTGEQQQTTNPFRQSIISSQPQHSYTPLPMDRQSTNPFTKSVPGNFNPNPSQNQHLAPPPEQGGQFSNSSLSAVTLPLVPTHTGTNPFARNQAAAVPNGNRPQTSAGLQPQPTGSTNPFRQASFVNTATRSPWQNNGSLIGGGFDSLESMPVFPRPVQQQPWG